MPRFRNATHITLWGPGGVKMQPLLDFGAPGLQKCNLYCTFGTRGLKNGTLTTLWGLGGPNMQPLLIRKNVFL